MALTLAKAFTTPLPGHATIAKFYSLSNPAASTDWTTTVPAGESWTLISVQAVLSAAAGGGTRVPSLFVTFGGASAYTLPVPGGIIGGTAPSCVWGSGCSAVANGIRLSTSVPSILIPPCGTVNTFTDNLAAGDQWSLISIFVLT